MKGLYCAFIISSYWMFYSSYADMCNSPVSKAMRLSITSRRNNTGHWIAQVKFDHGGGKEDPLEERETGPFVMLLEHSTSVCEEKEQVHITADVIAPPRVASPGYELFPGIGYYKFHSDPQVWQDARKTCAKEGAHLAIINSENESKVLQQLFSRYPKINNVRYNDFAFIGFHDLITEGQYVTIFGNPIAQTGFTRWAGPGQPDNAGGNPGEDCGSVHRNGGLNDLICDSKHAFICEQEIW